MAFSPILTALRSAASRERRGLDLLLGRRPSETLPPTPGLIRLHRLAQRGPSPLVQRISRATTAPAQITEKPFDTTALQLLIGTRAGITAEDKQAMRQRYGVPEPITRREKTAATLAELLTMGLAFEALMKTPLAKAGGALAGRLAPRATRIPKVGRLLSKELPLAGRFGVAGTLYTRPPVREVPQELATQTGLGLAFPLVIAGVKIPPKAGLGVLRNFAKRFNKAENFIRAVAFKPPTPVLKGAPRSKLVEEFEGEMEQVKKEALDLVKSWTKEQSRPPTEKERIAILTDFYNQAVSVGKEKVIKQEQAMIEDLGKAAPEEMQRLYARKAAEKAVAGGKKLEGLPLGEEMETAIKREQMGGGLFEELEQPTKEELAAFEEQVEREVRAEMKKEKIETFASKGRSLQNFLAGMRPTKEGMWALPEKIKGKKINWDEVADELGYRGGSVEPKSGQIVNAGLYEDLVALKGGQPAAPVYAAPSLRHLLKAPKPAKAKKISLPQPRPRISGIPDLGSAVQPQLGFETPYVYWPKLRMRSPKMQKAVNAYMRLDPRYYEITTPLEGGVAVSAEATAKTLTERAIKEKKALIKTQEQLYDEWQASYRKETITPRQALEKGFMVMKEATDQSVKDRLAALSRRLFGIDFRSPEHVFDKMGQKHLWDNLLEGEEKVAKEIAHHTVKTNGWFKRLKGHKDARRKTAMWLDGQPVVLDETEQKVAQEVKDYYAKWADRLGLPEDKRISNYLTHIFDPDLRKGELPAELIRILDFVTPSGVFNPFLEKRLGAKGYKLDVFDALDAYVYRGAKKLYLDKPIGEAALYAKNLPLQAGRYIERFLKNYNNRPGDFEKLIDDNFFNALPPAVKNQLGRRPTQRLVHLSSAGVYRGVLGFNISPALKNLTQGVNTFTELGAKDTIVGYLQLLQKGTGELYQTGAMADMLIAEHRQTGARTAMRRFDNALFFFFDTAEKINRGSAYYGAKQRALNLGASEAEAIRYAKSIVRKTQFQYGRLGLPLALQSPAGRILFQLGSFPLKQAEFVTGKVRQKEYAALARYTLSSLAVYVSLGKMLGIDIEDAFMKNIFPTIGPIPSTATGLISGQEYEKEKKLKSLPAMLIPGGIQARKTLQGLEAIEKGGSYTPGGQLRFPITPEDRLTALLFGSWRTAPGQAYLEEKYPSILQKLIVPSQPQIKTPSGIKVGPGKPKVGPSKTKKRKR